jgi:hypothetical protein
MPMVAYSVMRDSSTARRFASPAPVSEGGSRNASTWGPGRGGAAWQG